ncbi:M16 family metallopeptidase [Aquisalimonas asiatica]|uniref:Zinc protease n=1 Tax=Aquisalimonas asiatica TaxID=406100 RepID=A0A1H8VFP1_9GAMM|nr:pitrilysin family protein [Aquisalimonas asiatica]SEP14276.1 zinc protease [Aquisalimonas asiatica]
MRSLSTHFRNLLGTAMTLGALALAAPAHAALDIQHWTSDDGLDVYFVQSETLPMVDVRLTFDAGSARDGDHPGLASLTSNLLSEGAGGLDAGEIARRFEDQGARFSTTSGRDSASISLRSLNEPDTMSAAVEALTMVVREPDFPEAAVDRERRRMLVSLRNSRNDPGSIAREAFWEALYGDHPYASNPGGTEESLEALDRDAVRDFFDRYYVAETASLAIVGDISRAEAEAIADHLGGSLREGERPDPIPEPEPTDKAGETIHIPFSTNQSHVLQGQIGYPRGDDDHFPLYVGNHVLGGSGLVSRLAEEMREERGLSYSVGSRFQPMTRSGPFFVNTQIRADRTEEALEVLDTTVRSLRDDGPGEDELRRAIRNITGSFPLQLDSNRGILGYVAVIGFHDLPLDYLDTFQDNVEAVSADDVRDAMQRRLDPDQFTTVIVGPQDEHGEEPEED